MAQTITRDANGMTRGLSRSFKFDRAKIDKEKRTVEMSFASESPVERWGEQEVLGHNQGEYDFSRIADGGHPLLLGHKEHDPDSQIGVIESARVDGDHIARCIARFGNSPKADEIFRDVCDGIRQYTSVGYDHTGIVRADKATNGMTTTRYRWMPTHVAIVPVPADTNSGVGRGKDDPLFYSAEKLSADDIFTKLEPEQKQRMRILLDPALPIDKGNSTTPPADSVAAYRERQKGIRELGDAVIKDHACAAAEIRALVQKAADDDMQVKEFRSEAFKVALEVRAKQPPITMAARGASREDRLRYSILRGVQSCLKNGGKIPKDGIEREWHDELVTATGGSISAGGFLVPHDAPCRSGKGIYQVREDGSPLDARQQRDLTVGVYGQGGATVATILELPIIEVLRNKLVLAKRGIITMAGLTSNVAIPRQTAAGTAYSLPEQGLVTVSNEAIDQIALVPHRISFQGRYSRQLLIQSSIDVEGFIRDDAMKVLALKADYLGLFGGGGADEPTGIVNQPGISSVTFGGAPTFAAMVNMETALAALNADVGNMAYVTSALGRGVLKQTAKTLTGATTVVQIAIWDGQDAEGEGMINGYVAACSNQILGNITIFADWSSIIMGLFGGFDVVVDPYTQAGSATNVITINAFIDFALRHAQSVCVSTDSTAQ